MARSTFKTKKIVKPKLKKVRAAKAPKGIDLLLAIHRANFLDAFRQYMEAGRQQGADVNAATYLKLYQHTALLLDIDVAYLEAEVPPLVAEEKAATPAPAVVAAVPAEAPKTDDNDLNVL